MNKKLFTFCVLSLMAALAWGQSPVVKVEGGLLQGVASASSGVTVFRGIPYAAPPVGNPKDIANMVLYLCSDKAGFITGENICIDGGMTHQMIYHGDNGWTLGV